MNTLQTYSYHNSPVGFELIDGEVYASATAMCKPFEKRPNDWYALADTQRYIQAITRNSGKSQNQLFIKKTGSPEFGGGTWIHEKLVLKLAQWLDVDFEVWCDEQIAAILRSASTGLAIPSYQIDDPIQRAERWIQEQKDKQALLFENAELKPKAQYADAVLMSESALTTTKIAQELGMSAQALNKTLRERGVQYKQSGMWNLHAKYNGKGYAKLRTFVHSGSDGTHRSEHHLVWTETGRLFIHDLLNPALTVAPAPLQLTATA